MSGTLDLLKEYLSSGFYLLPLWGLDDNRACRCKLGSNCRAPAKHPLTPAVIAGVNGASNDESVVTEWNRRNPTCNWGIRTGTELPGGGYLGVVDIDPRSNGDETFHQMETANGRLPECPTVLTGGGGQHFYLRFPIEPHGSVLGPGVDFKGLSGYVVAPFSRHQSGGGYSWDMGAGLEIPIPGAPAWLVNDHTARQDRPDWSGRSARDSLVGRAFINAGLAGIDLPEGRLAVKCPWYEEHSQPRSGDGQDSSTVVLAPIAGSNFGTFVCKHSHCAHRRWVDVAAALPESAVNEAMQTYPLVPVQGGQALVGDTTPNGAAAVIDLKQLLTFNPKTGATIADGPNVVSILSYDSRWRTEGGEPLLQFDEFSREIRFAATAPWHPDDAPLSQEHAWGEDDDIRVSLFLRRHYGFEMPRDKVMQYAKIVASRWSSHPVQDYLNSLTWDGKRRLDTWLTDYMGCEQNTYHSIIGRWWMISAVARVMNPGCKADGVLILEGVQGIGKSTALEILATNRSWFSDTPFTIGDKDGYLGLRGKWIVELAELESMSRADTNKQKAFFAANADSYRSPYDRKTATVPRQCVFAGTTNSDGYLRDATGARRFWPAECTKVDVDSLRSDVHQLWAEALSCYAAGAVWYPTTDSERAMLGDESRDRQQSDAWDDIIVGWLQGDEAAQLLRVQGYIKLSDLYSRALKLDAGHQDHGGVIRLGMIMARAVGWEKIRPRVDGMRVTAWRKI